MKTPTQLDRVRFDPIRIYDETNAHTNYHSIISLDWVQITLFPTQIWPGKSREIPRGQEIFKVTSDKAYIKLQLMMLPKGNNGTPNPHLVGG